MTTIKTLLVVAAAKRWSLTQLNVSNAFLNGVLAEEIYMLLPPGYMPREGESLPENLVCRLNKSLYRLKQASRQWFLKFSNTLRSLGFAKSYADHTLFIKNIGKTYVVVLVYVDDIIIAGNENDVITQLKKDLQSHFKIRDLGPFHYFLEMEIARTTSGKMMYLTITRLDITFAVNKLFQFTSAPKNSHLQAAYKVLRFLKGTIGKGQFYSANCDQVLKAFTDANWGSCKDTRRSTSGLCLYLGQSLISWKSKKQPIIPHSSAESEYMAMRFAVQEVEWIVHLLEELQTPQTRAVPFYCDSTATIHIANNSSLS